MILPPFLLVGCSGDERIAKSGPLPAGLEIFSAGLTPETPAALERPIAWAEARDAKQMTVYVAYATESAVTEPDFLLTEDRFKAYSLTTMDEGQQPRRWEVELDPRPADRLLFYRFVAEDVDGGLASFPAGGFEDAVPVGSTPFVIDFPWPDWRDAFDPVECAYDAELFDLDYAVPGAPFQELNDPIFVPPNRATILGSNSGTSDGIGLEIDGQAYFFPLSILLWQEVVNTTVGGRSGVVSYCPLTDTAMFFYHDDTHPKTKNWEVGGLFNSNLVLLHRDDPLEQVPQMLSWGVSGEIRGECVELQPSFLCNWKIGSRLYPDTKILNGDRADFDIDWQSESNVYRNYWRDHSEIRFPVEHVDSQHPLGMQNKTVMLGIVGEGSPIAIPFEVAGERHPFVVNFDRNDREFVVFAFPGAGFGAVFDRRNPDTGELLNFHKANASWNSYRLFEDDQDPPSLWTSTGVAIAGPSKGQRLSWVPSMRSFWFAWFAMYPNSEVMDPYLLESP